VSCIRRSGVGLASSIVLYNTCALPVLSHIAQLFIPSQELIDRVEALSPRIISAPAGWVNHFVLTHLRLLLPFPQDLLDFKTFCQAVRCRVMFRQFTSWTSFDASNLVNLDSSVTWFHDSPAVSFRKSFKDFINSGFLSSRGVFKDADVQKSVSALDSKMKFQGKVYFARFYVPIGNKFSSEINRRLDRLNIPDCVYSNECTRVALKLFGNNCPTRVFNSLAVTWLNGWVTERRRQTISSHCPYCTLWFSCESIEHFAVCKYFRCLGEYFLLLPKGNSLRIFLLFVDASPQIICKRALHIYLCKSMFDALRHGDKTPGFRIYRANLMKFVSKNSNFIQTYCTTINDNLGILMNT
jgi:hypothetical protein